MPKAKTKTKSKKKTTGKSFPDLLKSKKGEIVYRPGDEIEGEVISLTKNRVLLDLSGVTTGVVTGREVLNAPAGLKVGKKTKATVYDSEDEDGSVILSFRASSKGGEGVTDFGKDIEEGKIVKVRVTEANRGGLLVSSGKLKGFLPVSQLSPKNYPRVEGGDKDKILERLKKFIGQEFETKVININRENNDIIFSERAARLEDEKGKFEKLKIGSVVKGEVSGVVDFGLFIQFDEMEGLIHISEVSWDRVEDIHRDFHVGDKVRAKIIGIDDGKISLSLKQTKRDPWLEKIKEFKVGDTIKGNIKRLTPFGAFIDLKEGAEGLIHISEITDKRISDPSEVLKLGEEIKAKVISMEPEEHKIGLSIKALKKKEEVGLEKIKALSKSIIEKLKSCKIDSVEKLKGCKVEDLTKVKGIGEAKAKKILLAANKFKK